ncbi:MAG: lipopolysaccharide core heptose(I) kinase RfaP [Gammaproteobacteria bacterium AqS3]|nr:lipopolysaccharide core heptose(I) kinase RfaP [Gammaproteobacteria bacterium AqS3]
MWWSRRHNFVDEALHPLLGGDVWAAACALRGEVVRSAPGRRTLRFEHGGQTYYIKQHFGAGWGELLKNWLTGKHPVLSAVNELRAARRLQNAGVAAIRVRAFWREGVSPAHQRSLIVSEALPEAVQLDHLLQSWGWKFPSPQVRAALIDAVGALAGGMFDAGVAHRDCYACHFMVSKAWADHPAGRPELFLLDLHRAYCGVEVPRRLMVRDLAQLLFSLGELELSLCDRVRFARALCGTAWRSRRRDVLRQWGAITARAQALHRRHRS